MWAVHDRTENQPALDRGDIALRYLCAVLPMLFYGVILTVVVSGNRERLVPALVDVGLGLVGLVLMRWRRRWPWPIALATAVLTAFSTTATGPAQVAYVSLCTHRRWRQFVPVAGVSWLCLVARSSWNGIDQATVHLGGDRHRRPRRADRLRPVPARPPRPGRVPAGGRARRRTRTAAADRAGQAGRSGPRSPRRCTTSWRTGSPCCRCSRAAWRTGRISLAEETRKAALTIQENAHQSLNELRTVLGDASARRRPGGPAADPGPRGRAVRRGTRRRPAGRRGRHHRRPGPAADADRAACVPDRAGGPDQCAQARAGQPGDGRTRRRAGRRAADQGEQPGAVRDVRGSLAGGWGWSAWPNGPGWPVAPSAMPSRTADSFSTPGCRGRPEHRDPTGDRGRRPDGADRAAAHPRRRARPGPRRRGRGRHGRPWA